MGLDYVDIFYSHRFDPDTPVEETMMALDQAVRQGKALYAGISSYSAAKTREAASIARELGTPLLIHQPSYSMLNRWIEEDLLDELEEQGMGCIVFAALAQGLLTDRYLDGVPADSRAARDGSSIGREHLEERSCATSGGSTRSPARGQKLAQLALQWAIRDPRVTSRGHRCVERRAARREPRRARVPGAHREELRAIDEDAVRGGHQPWARVRRTSHRPAAPCRSVHDDRDDGRWPSTSATST